MRAEGWNVLKVPVVPLGVSGLEPSVTVGPALLQLWLEAEATGGPKNLQYTE